MNLDTFKLEMQMKMYVDVEKPASDEFKRHLTNTEPADRYQLLIQVRRKLYPRDTCLMIAAYIRDLPTVKLMLDGIGHEEKYNILQLTNHIGCTALHNAFSEQRQPYSSELIEELTSSLSTEKLYHLLGLRTKRYEATVFHYAMYANRTDFVAPFLTKLTEDQIHKLLSIRDATGATLSDVSVPTIFSNAHGLYETKQEVRKINEELVKQKSEKNHITNMCWELERRKVQQTDVIVEQKRKLNVQKNRLEQPYRGLREVLQNIERLNTEQVKQGTVKNQLRDRCKELERQKVQRSQGLREVQQSIVRVNKELVRQETVQSQHINIFKKLERHKVQQSQELRVAEEKVKTLRGKFTELEIHNVNQQKINEGQAKELTEQNILLSQLSQKYTELKEESLKQAQTIEEANKVLTDLEQSTKEQIKALKSQSIIQTAVIAGQRKKISEHGQMQQILLDKCAELERQTQEQEELIAEQTIQIQDQKNQLIEQGRDLEEIKELLAYLQISVDNSVAVVAIGE